MEKWIFQQISGKKNMEKFEKASRRYLWHAGFFRNKKERLSRPNFCAKFARAFTVLGFHF